MGQMQWIGEGNATKVLHLRLNPTDQWEPYTHPRFAHLRKPEYNVPGGSKGFSTMQALLKTGFVYAK